MRPLFKYSLSSIAVITVSTIFYFSISPNINSIDEVTSHAQQVEQSNSPSKLTFDEALQKIIKNDLPGKPTKQKLLSVTLKGHVNELSSIVSSIKSKGITNKIQYISLLESKSYEFDVMREELNRQLDDDSKNKSGATIAGVNSFKEKLNSRFEKLNEHIDSVLNAASNSEFITAVTSTEQYIQTLQKPKLEPGLPQPTIKTPTKIKHNALDAKPPAYMSLKLNKHKNMLASIGDINALQLAWTPPVAPDTEATRCDYTPADLAESSPEIVFDDRIKDLAEELEYNPLKIYEYVANEISYQEYTGSLKGATATLVSGAGNSTDQASLLSALLRISKIPTRYIRGAIDFETSDDRGLNWMGVKANAAFTKVAPGGAIYDSGARYGMSSHVWVQACVPYDNYRGSTTDRSGYHWIPLDPSYEQYEYVQGETVPVGFTLDNFLYGAGGYMLTRTNKLPHEAFEEALSTYVGKPIREVGYAGTKIKVKHDILPSTLPYRVRNFVQWGNGITASETASIPSGHRYSLSITVKNKSGTVLHPLTRFDMPAIALKRITLRFDGATQEEVDNAVCVDTGVTPVIAVEGVDQVVSGKASVSLCSSDNILDMVIHYGLDTTINKVNSVNYSNIGAHNYHSLQAYALQASELLIEERTDKILTTVGQVAVPNDSQDETLGEYLHVVGLKYMDYITRASVRVGAMYGGYGVLGNHLGLTSTRKKVSYIFDLPYRVSGDGFLIDVGGGIGGVFDDTAGTTNFDAFVLSGYTSSAYESYIWQEMGHLDAVSSVRGIQFANETGLQVSQIVSGDILDKPWDPITLSNNLFYSCPPWGIYTKPSLPSGYSYSGDNIVINTGYNSTFGFTKISATDTSTSSVKGLVRLSGAGYQNSIDINYSDGYTHVCNLTTPSSQLPRNRNTDPDAELGYHQQTLTSMANTVLEGGTVVAPVKKINYNNWQGVIYIAAAQRANGSAYASFIISGDYVAGGGYTVGYPVSSVFNPVTNTGFSNNYVTSPVTTSNPIPTSWADSLWVDSTTSSNTSISVSDGPSNTVTGIIDDGFVTLGGDPVNLVSGNMYHAEKDIQLKGRGGLNIAFNRTYNSHIRKDGPMGYGWTHSLNHQLKFFDTDSNGTTDRVVWLTGNGATSNFDVSGSASGVAVNQALSNQAGSYVIAIREASGQYSIKEKNGLTFFFENVKGAPDTTAKLASIVDKNGNTLNFAYSGNNLQTVTDDIGRNLTFYYDDINAHITRIIDWSGQTYRFTYTNNNLVSYETPLAVSGKVKPTIYSYYVEADGNNLDHAMKSFSNPENDGMTFEYYSNGKVFRHINSLGKTYTFRYNKFRRETTTIDEKGIRQTYLFNEWGQQLEHIQGDESKRYYEYNDSANPMNETVVRHSLGYETQHQYDVDGDLNKSTLPDNSTLEYFGKNAFHQYCTTKNGAGNYSLSRYDANGNKEQTIILKKGVSLSAAQANNCGYVPPSSNIQAWTINSYDTVGNLKISKRVNNFTTQAGPYVEYTYDGNNLNPTDVKRCGMQHNSSGVLTNNCVSDTQTFDSLGRITKSIGADFYPKEIEYDSNGRVSRTTDSTGQWRDFNYDDNGNLISQHLLAFSAAGKLGMLVQDSIKHDALKRPVLTQNIAGYATRTEYDDIGNVTKVTNPDGYSVRIVYDNMNRPTRAFDEQGHEVKTHYDIGGRPTSTIDPNGNPTTYEYYGAEENGRLKKVTSADGRTQQYFYDNNGNVIRTLDNIARESLTDFDSLNRPVRTVGPVTNNYNLPSTRQVTVTEYNELGFVTKIKAGYTANITGAVGSDVLVDQATYQYDDFGRVITETDANGKATQTVYDIHGNVLKTTAANGHAVSYVYDHARKGLLNTQIAKLSASDPNPLMTSYQYNALGQIIAVTTPDVIYSYGYDNANRLQTITDSRGGKTLTYDYSPGGLLNSVADSDGKRTDFLYDAASRLTAMLAANGDRVSFIFDAGGRLSETSMPDGYKASYKYDSGNNLIQLVNSTSQGIISQHDYTYDAASRRETHLENIAGTTTDYKYVHDTQDRMTEVLTGGGATSVEQYQYDQFNNRRTRTPNATTPSFYQYDAAQQLNTVRAGSDTGSVTASYAYDDSGNLTNKTEGTITRIYSYNALNQLNQVQGSNISTENYKYDHQGRRIEKSVGSNVNRYTYSGISLWAEFGASWGAAIAHYNYTGVDQAIIRSTPTTANTRYYHNDGLGSAVATTNAAGTLQNNARYNSWGKVIGGGGIPQYGFTGRQPDATGLTYFRARYYDPGMGRFTQRDPIGFAGGLNPYTYVGNSPQNFTDPLGLVQAAVTVGSSSQSTAYGGNPAITNLNVLKSWGSVIANFAIDTATAILNAGSPFGNLGSDLLGNSSVNCPLPDACAAAGALAAVVTAPLAISKVGKFGSLSNSVTNTTRVGRWMSPVELSKMKTTGLVQEGGGGLTFVANSGASSFRSQAKSGSNYVEFNVPTNSLLQGGKDDWLKTLGPNAPKSQLYNLNKQGGQISPPFSNLSNVLETK